MAGGARDVARYCPGGVGEERRDRAAGVRRAQPRGPRGDASHAAPDIEFDFASSDGPWTGTHHGRERLIESFDSLSEAFDQLSWEAQEFIDADDAVIVPVRFYARGRESEIEATTRAVQVAVGRAE